MGMSLMALRKYKEAEEMFKKSITFFKKTKDPRGLAYARIGIAKILIINGKTPQAKRLIKDVISLTKEYRLRLEQCHAEVVLSSIEGLADKRCYDRLGIKALPDIP
jgi:hypothetical protein